MSERKPNDGRPYYCVLCGCGFGEYLACELPDCKLETEAEAQDRRKRCVRRRAVLARQQERG